MLKLSKVMHFFVWLIGTSIIMVFMFACISRIALDIFKDCDNVFVDFLKYVVSLVASFFNADIGRIFILILMCVLFICLLYCVFKLLICILKD